MMLADVVEIAPPAWWQVALPYLVALVTGAVGGGVVSLFGAEIQSKRDHERWLKEERLENYATLLRIIAKLEKTMKKASGLKPSVVTPEASKTSDLAAVTKSKSGVPSDKSEVDELNREVNEVVGRGHLLTSKDTDDSIKDLLKQIGDSKSGSDQISKARNVTIAAMRKDLDIP
jgi:dGTP triphosphohydrolase